MEILEHFSLEKYNSFKLKVEARYFVQANSIELIKDAIAFATQQNIPYLVIGGGSNILFSGHYNGLVIQNNIQGIEHDFVTDELIKVTAFAGENWHGFVQFCLQQGWYGIENLSLIPGNVGACPIQNIGAYGVEVKDVIDSVTCWHIEENKLITLTNRACGFTYRNSIFKTSLKNKVIIVSVQFLLSTQPKTITSYGAIQQHLQLQKIDNPTPLDVANTVIAIRQSKLPNPAVIGNAGSFFKNPIVSMLTMQQLKEQYHNIPQFAGNSNDNYKLSAAWLIEQCGFKGYQQGDAGCYHLQPLVLVNYGNATGEQLLNLANTIIKTVQKKFGVLLEREVNVV